MTNYEKYDTILANIEKDWWNMKPNPIPSAQWEVPKYTKREIIKAGKILSQDNIPPEEEQSALNVLNNWRSSHAYPLHIIAKKLRSDNPQVTVVQRLKRLDSITQKLKRFPEMSLWRMQDLGGCRVIVNSINDVYQTVDKYRRSNVRHQFKRDYDYIQRPKDSGYRSYHMVYQYHSDKTDTYNHNMLIEIQVRTKLQHIWATAVEIMGIYTKTALKAGQGDESIKRFFILVSSIFAIQENTPVCPNTYDNYVELVAEIKQLNKEHNILQRLEAISAAISYTSQRVERKRAAYYLLKLNYATSRLEISSFNKSEIELATYAYDQIESRHYINIDVVLVSANSFETVRAAYPNYFTDIGEFIGMISKFLEQ